MALLDEFATLYGLEVEEVEELMETENGRQQLGLTESVPVETQMLRLVTSWLC